MADGARTSNDFTSGGRKNGDDLDVPRPIADRSTAAKSTTSSKSVQPKPAGTNAPSGSKNNGKGSKPAQRKKGEKKSAVEVHDSDEPDEESEPKKTGGKRKRTASVAPRAGSKTARSGYRGTARRGDGTSVTPSKTVAARQTRSDTAAANPHPLHHHGNLIRLIRSFTTSLDNATQIHQ